MRSRRNSVRAILSLLTLALAVTLSVVGCGNGSNGRIESVDASTLRQALSSDPLNGVLTGDWTFVDPVGNSSFAVTANHLELSVPAGSSHDPWPVLNATRMMQEVGNVDFEVEAKFDSVPTQQYQLHGIVVEQDQNNFIRFDYFSDGSAVHFFASSFVNASPNVRTNDVVSLAAGHRIRVARTGNTWTASASADGTTWMQMTSFQHSLTVADVGVMVGNAGGNPAYTARVDHFIDVNAPPEPCTGGPYTIDVAVVGDGSVALSPDKAQYDCDDIVSLTATPDPGNVFLGYSGDITDASDVAVITVAGDLDVTATFDAEPVVVSGLASDDFSGPLVPEWSFIDPVGNSSFSVGSGQLSLSVPGGSSHDPWPVLNAARMMQAVGDVDFEVEAKFDSVPSQQYQLHGIVVEQDQNNFIRFDYYSDGSVVRFFAASFVNANSNVRQSTTVSLAPGHRLRVGRSGDTWTASASPDGVTWTQMTSFQHSLAVASVGVMAGNAGPNPAYTALVDYFDDTSAPSDPPPPPPACTGGPFTLDVDVVGDGSVSLSPNKAQYDCDDVVTFTATPDPGNVFLGFSGDVTDSASSTQVTVASDLDVTATFELEPVVVTGLASDDFSGPLVPEWSFVDPVGNSSHSLGSGQLSLSVPGGSSHDPWPVLNAARMMQAVGDVDFEVEAKFDSVPSQQYQLHGIAVEQDQNNFIRFDYYSDGSVVHFFAASFVSASPNVRHSAVVSLAPGHRLRVDRSGDTWTASASPDGVTWTQMTSFQHSLAVASVGVMAGNAGPNPAYTALVDYFDDTSAPSDPPPPPPACTGGPFTLDVDVVGDGSVSLSPNKAQYDCDDVVTFTATPDPGNVFLGFSGDVTDSASSTQVTVASDLDVTATFELEPVVVTGLASDDFSGGLAPEWSFVDPVGNSSYVVQGGGSGNATLQLSVPSGSSHDPWLVLNAARMMQAVGDVDFEVEAKFDSVPSQQYQLQGIVVEEDDTNFIRFDYYSDGAEVRFFVASFENGSNDIHASLAAPIGVGHRLRVGRSGDTWTAWDSPDGVAWTERASFQHAIAVEDVGVMAGNAGGNPAYTASVDYFFDTAAPIDPEDGPLCEPSDTFVVSVTPPTGGSIEVTPAQAQYACEDVITVTATPDEGYTFVGWTSGPPGSEPSVEVVVGDDLTIAAEFEEYNLAIDLWYGSELEFGHVGMAQPFANVMGHVEATAGLVSATYSLNGAPDEPLSVNRESYRLIDVGDFNLDIHVSDLVEGINVVEITAEDATGTIVTETVTLDYVTGNAWPTTYSVDWSTVSEIQDAAQVVDGRWILTPEGPRIAEPGYDRLLGFGDASWVDYEVLVSVTINDLHDPENWAPELGIATRWNGHYDWNNGQRPFTGWHPNGGIVSYGFPLGASFRGIKVWQPDGSIETFYENIPFMNVGETYYIRLRITSQPGGFAHYDYKFWDVNDAEPGAWLVSTDSLVPAPASGGILLIAHEIDVTWHDLQVTPL